MRIVGGEARGRRLFAPEGTDTRPTADRVRESLFNILSQRVRGARVLDLFAGSGALSLEAISRGAQGAVLVELDRVAAGVIRRNIELMRAEGVARLLQMDYVRAIGQLSGAFDIVFMDPPYRMLEAYGEAARRLRDGGLLSPGAVLLMEHRSKSDLSLPDGFEIYDERRYGECAVALVREG